MSGLPITIFVGKHIVVTSVLMEYVEHDVAFLFFHANGLEDKKTMNMVMPDDSKEEPIRMIKQSLQYVLGNGVLFFMVLY